MDRPDLFKEKKKKKAKEKEDLFKEIDIEPDSDHPVHEEFVDARKLRKARHREEEEE